MKMPVFSVRDGAVGSFLAPFFTRSAGEAIRSFSDAVRDEQHQFNKHKSDYVLFSLGHFDDASGLFHPTEPQRVLSANEVDAPTE